MTERRGRSRWPARRISGSSEKIMDELLKYAVENGIKVIRTYIRKGGCSVGVAYKFNMEFQKSDEGALFLFHFFKKFWPDRFDTPPLSKFSPRNSVYKFWPTFSKNRLGFASVLGKTRVLDPGIECITRKPAQAET